MSIQKLYIAPNECIVYNQNKKIQKKKNVKIQKQRFIKRYILSGTTRLQ